MSSLDEENLERRMRLGSLPKHKAINDSAPGDRIVDLLFYRKNYCLIKEMHILIDYEI